MGKETLVLLVIVLICGWAQSQGKNYLKYFTTANINVIIVIFIESYIVPYFVQML